MDTPTPAPPDQPKKAGRPKGSKNKRSTELEALLKEWGCDPFQTMAKIAKATDVGFKDVSMDLRLSACKELAKYIRPQLKAIEHTVGEDGRISILVGGNPPAKEEQNDGDPRRYDGQDPELNNSGPEEPTGTDARRIGFNSGPDW